MRMREGRLNKLIDSTVGFKRPSPGLKPIYGYARLLFRHSLTLIIVAANFCIHISYLPLPAVTDHYRRTPICRGGSHCQRIIVGA